MIAVMVFSDDPHLYSAQPFIISGTYKCEDINSQQKLHVLQCTRSYICSIASDGDSRQHLTTANLTSIQEIAPDSELQSQLGDLALFNYLCGAYDVTVDIDYKHLLK